MTSSSQFRPGPPAALNTPAFTAQAQQIVDMLINLTEKQKCIAEYWADGPNSELPPGHWNLFAQVISERDKHDNDKDVRLFFALTNAVFDAGIATWECKRFYDYVRPISAIRYLFNSQTIKVTVPAARQRVWSIFPVPAGVRSSATPSRHRHSRNTPPVTQCVLRCRSRSPAQLHRQRCIRSQRNDTGAFTDCRQQFADSASHPELGNLYRSHGRGRYVTSVRRHSLR
jgi:hypothetical protein